MFVRRYPHPNLPPVKPGEGVSFPLPLGEGSRVRAVHLLRGDGCAIPSPGFAGGGQGWGPAMRSRNQ
jgi:hypothetical protein